MVGFYLKKCIVCPQTRINSFYFRIIKHFRFGGIWFIAKHSFSNCELVFWTSRRNHSDTSYFASFSLFYFLFFKLETENFSLNQVNHICIMCILSLCLACRLFWCVPHRYVDVTFALFFQTEKFRNRAPARTWEIFCEAIIIDTFFQSEFLFLIENISTVLNIIKNHVK